MANKSNLITDAKVSIRKKKYSVSGIEFEIYSDVSYLIKSNIVTTVGNLIYDNADALILRECIFWICVAKGYTTIEIPELKDNSDICSIYDMLNNSGIKDKLVEVIPYSDIKEMNDNIDNYINFKNGKYVAKHDYVNDLTTFINSLFDTSSGTHKSFIKLLEMLDKYAKV